jgi:glycosyltransferase involved in cell wall biosynthesis
MREKLSVFVVTYNRASLLETCLRALSFADELIVVDKSSTDESVAVASRHAHRVEIVPWSPTVEETRAFALSLCSNEWVLFLDDDEILSPASEPYLRDAMAAAAADIYTIPYRHYILGLHDERAYYWPEVRHCLFRKGGIEFIPTVHGGVALQSDRILAIPVESGVCIHHLSYRDVASWIDRTNRYTGRPDRVQAEGGNDDLIRFSHDRIDHWMERTARSDRNDYPAAVALLRAIYDIVDRLKSWEAERGLDGEAMLRIAQANLALAFEGLSPGNGVTDDPRQPLQPRSETTLSPQAETRDPEVDNTDQQDRQAMQVQLRSIEAQLRERTEAGRRTMLSWKATREQLSVTSAELNEAVATLAQERNVSETMRREIDETRDALDHATSRLAEANREIEQLGGSARVFVRQYLPRLRRHLSRGGARA